MGKPGMGSSGSSKKRKYYNRGMAGGGGRTGAVQQQHNKKWSNPKRGGPGILLTCETGRERKCQNEGLDILNYYLSNLRSSVQGNDDEENGGESGSTSMTLEEELKMLKSKKDLTKLDPSSVAFGVYETGCRGSLFVLCTLPDCQLIPPIQTEYMQTKNNETTKNDTETDDGGEGDNNANIDGGKDGGPAKKPRLTVNDDDKEDQAAVTTSGPTVTGLRTKSDSPRRIPWDPIVAVKSVMADLDAKSKRAPSSRFVTRMIPIQATCFASLEEIRLTSVELLKVYLSPKTKTFAVVPKRRHCDSLTRDQIINTVAGVVLDLIPTCKVQLEEPDATIVVEICKNICGISVVEDYGSYRNFNLFTAKDE